MTSLYARFFKEIAGWETVETPEFFVTYQLSSCKEIKSLKIVNAFVIEEARSKGKSYEILDLMEKMAKENDCSIFSAVVAKDSSEFIQQRTIHILRTNGMSLIYEDDYNKIFSRRI